jgi:hypothetical protein
MRTIPRDRFRLTAFFSSVLIASALLSPAGRAAERRTLIRMRRSFSRWIRLRDKASSESSPTPTC